MPAVAAPLAPALPGISLAATAPALVTFWKGGLRGWRVLSEQTRERRLADRILALAGGRIVEAGTHDELLALGGEYARLFAAQARWYRSRQSA